MPLIEDHEQACPTISEGQLQFVLCLDDTHRTYTRFIAALLIPRPSYAAFFRDLRCFRSQPVVIGLLSTCDQSSSGISKEEIKQTYREVTSLFLKSRWSHPWCRKAAGNRDLTGSSSGWWGAEWTSTGRRMGRKEKEAEERLHKLLLPIWVIMRGRMFPGEAVVVDWLAKKKETEALHRKQCEMGLEQGVMVWLGKVDVDTSVHEVEAENGVDTTSDEDGAGTSPTSNNPFRKGGDQVLRPVKTTPNLREEFWNSAEAANLQDEARTREQESAQAATSAFRLIAAGMLLSTVPKWKLKKLLNNKT